MVETPGVQPNQTTKPACATTEDGRKIVCGGSASCRYRNVAGGQRAQRLRCVNGGDGWDGGSACAPLRHRHTATLRKMGKRNRRFVRSTVRKNSVMPQTAQTVPPRARWVAWPAGGCAAVLWYGGGRAVSRNCGRQEARCYGAYMRRCGNNGVPG